VQHAIRLLKLSVLRASFFLVLFFAFWAPLSAIRHTQYYFRPSNSGTVALYCENGDAACSVVRPLPAGCCARVWISSRL
jgi:hypothetical protein